MDPLSLEVIRHLLSGIAEEMGAALSRSAHSPNITEREDFSCALATPQGEMCAQAEHIPVHLGSMPASIEAVLQSFHLEDGDAVLVNDPFAGGTHLPDLTLVSAVFDDPGRLLGYVANRAHHADVGGRAPGSMPGDSTDISEEGVRISPRLIRRRGDEVDGALDDLLGASRSPRERLGDLRAQIGANSLGAGRLRELGARLGTGGLGEAMDSLIEYSERAVGAGIAALPDGSWEFEDRMDSSGQGMPPAAIRCRVTIDGRRMVFDFSGTDAQVEGNVNTVLAVTVSCVNYVVRAITGPDIPPTAGGLRPIEVIAPEGTVVNASFPAAVSAGNVETSQRIVDVLLGALSGGIPDRVPAASQGTMNNLLIGGEDFAYYETIGGGQGARPTADGMSGVHTHMTNTRNTPAEAIEYAYPLRVLRYELREGTGGEGLFRGGMGIRRDVQLLAHEGVVSLQTERRRTAPWGLAGGGPGAVGANALISGGEEAELPDKCTVVIGGGDVVSVRTPGGGGWGRPG
jgi:N-methylhydantoinase B